MTRKDNKEQELTPQQKTLLVQSTVMASLSYAVWAHSLKDPQNGVHNPKIIEDRVEDYGYIDEKQLSQKVDKILKKQQNPSVRYLIDELSNGIEETAVIPDLQQLGAEYKIAHFSGRTGFPRDGSPADSKGSVKSYMGSALLLGTDKPEEEQTVFISFRGSRGGKIAPGPLWDVQKGAGKGNPDWVTDLDFGREFTLGNVVKSGLQNLVGLSDPSDEIHTHSGITKSYNSCKAGINQALEEIGVDPGTFRGKIVFTGHSLGGGLATLAAYDFGQKYPAKSRKLHCITFSAPTVGNEAFVNKFKDCVPNSSRLLIDSDPVTIARSKSANLHHVHGKIDLTKASLDALEGGKLPKHLDCKSITRLDPRAHDSTKVFELTCMISGAEFKPSITTVSKFNPSLHAMIEQHLKTLIEPLSEAKYQQKSLLNLLTKLQQENNKIIEYCTAATLENADGSFQKNYLSSLQKMIDICSEIGKLKIDESQPTQNNLQGLIKDLKGALESEMRLIKEKQPVLQKSALVSGSMFSQTKKPAENPIPAAPTMHAVRL